MRVVFFGSPPFATPILEALLTSAFRPIAIVTQPERAAGRGRKTVASRVVELAQAHEIALLRPESAREPAFKAALRALHPDVALVASYGELLDEELLAIPRHGALNVHGSVLPRWRGASPVQAAILAGDAATGVTVQRMVKKLDAGDVLLARETAIGEEETAGELAGRLAELGAGAAIDALALMASGRAQFTPQDPAHATHCRKIDKDAGRIDWSQDASAIARHVRAFEPWPGARAWLDDGREIVVRRARAVPGSRAGPGELVVEGERLFVGTGAGALEILALQPAGKRTLTAREWLLGARLAPGARFTTRSPGE